MNKFARLLIIGLLLASGYGLIWPHGSQASIGTRNSFELTDDRSEATASGEKSSSAKPPKASQTAATELMPVSTPARMTSDSGIGTRVVSGMARVLPPSLATGIGLLNSAGELPQTSEKLGIWLMILGFQLCIIVGLCYLVIRQRSKKKTH